MSDITYVKMWEKDGSFISLSPEDEPRIDAAVSSFLENKRDSLLQLTTISGGTYKTKASMITSWRVSTPEDRDRSNEIEGILRSEDRTSRLAAGLPWKDDE